ncbi:MAG: efflux RND transporter periplasmic adaptor subunit [Rhodospirillaceae bacterium]|jgi:RND family efflux transporter MFP subunit|nr:efflux RND transporter periplasmic adaptor subunit [Rhodospirillaceae bacterium]MBT3883919.1 efflux RND transporter periplasmic adaptor subunit [Rhodospirillaceae bacterium]MBT4115136.1 efflux RND transporter periplasmic adaptor subunit [Rhodospirillaceae bacterium]MBT4674358.1 efflux RND transporter periplasmic adaptor subunit [Rhodospirillaceae bacterium]MBT4717780.1 efflux RND transporter periplasmic adaptor subunit [Rhodospirillaceae bacterium]
MGLRTSALAVRLASITAVFGIVANISVATAESFTIALQKIQDTKAVFATVESADKTDARARIAGVVGALSVDEGSRVKKGQVIAVVRDRKLPLRRQATGAKQRSLAAQARLADTEFKRVTSLRRSGAASQARLDQARARLDILHAEIAAIKSEIAVIDQQMKEGAVLAPAAGRVLKVRVINGGVVLPGEMIAEIATEKYVLRMHLPERHARTLSKKDRVRITALSSAGRAGGASEFRTGSVRQIYPEIINGRVIADVSVDGLGDFFVGERMRVFVPTGARQGIVVPLRYLFRRHGLNYVRIGAANVAEGFDTLVQLGQSVEGGTEILSGLIPGDVLMLPGNVK